MSKASERATELIEEIKKAAGIGDGLVEWWAEDADRVNKMAEKARKFAAKVTKAGKEGRAYCPTGKGGGVDNSCGAKQMMAPDKDGGGGAGGGKPDESKKSEPLTPQNIPQVNFRTSEVSHSEFMASRDKSTRKHNFSEISEEKFAESQIFLSSDGTAGCLVDKDGDLGNVFNNDGPKRAGSAAVIEAIKSGAKTLDCYEGHLTTLYSQLGFVPVAKLRFVDEYAPPDWDYEKNKRPDVVVMAYQGGDRQTIQSRAGTFPPYTALPDSEYTDDFDAAKRTARLASDSHEGRRSVRRDADQREGRGVRPRDARLPQGSVGDRENSLESRDDCVRDPSGRFGEGNKCQEGAGTGVEGQGVPRVVVNVAQQAISSPSTARSDDGKSIVSSSVGSREDGTIYKFGGREYVSTTAAGKYLADRQAESRGPAIDSAKPLGDKDREYVAESHVAQIQAAAGRGIKPVFYTPEERQRQIDEFSRIEPRINGGRTKAGFEVSPENAEFLFRAVQALTSSNASPFANMQRTDSVLSKVFDGDGRVSTSTSFGVTGAAIKSSLSRLQGVIDTLGKRPDGSIDPAMGLDKTRDLFTGTKMRAGDFDKFFREEFKGEGPSVKSWKPGSFLVDQEVPLFCTFGPKFGCFFANNTGDSAPLTADIWATRTWGRITGELVQEAKAGKAKDHANETLRVIKGANAQQLHGVDGNQLVDSLKKMSATGEIDDTVRAWSSARLRHYASTDYSEKRGTAGKLNKLAKNIVENDTSLMGDPGSGKRRANMIDVYDSISKATGLPVAYAQDVLWQDEQDAYAALGAKTATEQGKLSFYSDQIRKIAEDQSNRIARAKKERRNESQQTTGDYDDYETGGRENLLYWEMISHLSDEQFVKILLDIEGRTSERRAFCPTGEGGGVDNSCSTDDSPGDAGEGGGGDAGGSGPEINIGDKREEIDRRLDSMGVVEDDVVSMAGGASDGTYVFMRRDHDHEGGDGLHVETTRDVAGVKGGLFSQSVIYNAGPAEDPEIVVDHKLMDVKTDVSRDPEKRHAAAREFFRIMTGSVEASIKQGVSKVTLNAAGDPRQARDGMFKGYTIWPRMGFDAPIPFHVRNKLPETLSHCRSLIDLHATPEGTRWWRDNGTDLDVQLDLTRPDSPQMQIFGKFVRHFERSRRELAVGEGLDWLSPEDTAKLEELWEEIWDDGLLDDYEGESEDFSTLEKRAFCPTGEGGGIKNDCSASDGGGSSVKELDNSWEDSEEIVAVYEGKDLERRPPIEGAEKLRSLAIESPVDMKSALDEMGVSLSDAVTMCAAPSEGTTVIVSPEHPYDSMGLGTPGEESKAVAFVMTTKDVSGIKDALDSNSSLRKTSDGELVLEYHAFHASAEAQEKAAVACAKEVIGGVIKSVSLAEKSGVSEIRLDAAGSKDSEAFKGYRMWPKFGFDGVIPRKMLTRLREADLSPRAVAEKRAGKLTIQALYETKAGQKYWEDRGQEIPMWLRPGDQSTPGWERFKAYRQRLGKLAENRSFEAGDEIFSDEELKKLEELWEEFRKESGEKRGFCATGEGGGIDNSCGSDGKASPPPVEPAGLDVAMPSKNGWKSQEAVVYWDKNSLSGSVSPSKLLKAANSFTVVDGAELSGVLKNTGISLDDAIRVMASSDDDVNIIATAGDTAYAMGRMSGEGGGVASDSEFTVVSRKDVDGVTNAITVTTSMKRHESGELELKYTLLDVSPEVKENSRISIARQMMTSVTASIAAAEEVGVDTITMRAAGDASNDRYKGYRIWPRLGFDGEIPRNLVTRTWSPMKGVFNSYGDKIPDSVLSPKARQEKAGGKLTIQSLYETKEGQRWWEKYGGGMSMSLSVSDKESQGWKVYSKVRERFGKSSRDLLSAIAEAWIERRAFCPTGEGNGIDNSCSPKMAADKDGGGGGSATSSRWGGDEANWGTSSGTEIWTPGKPLFAGSESLAAIKIHKPDDIRQRIVDGLGMTVAEAVLASGPIKEAADRASITRPRLEIIPQQFGDGIEMHWSAMGVATGEGFQDDEKQFAKSGTAVKAVEASRNISKGRDGNVLHMAGFFVHPDFQGKGLALESVSKSVSSGAVRLVMEAERFDTANPNMRMTGYHVWPKYGYDAPIADVARALRSGSIPEQFAKAKSLLDIYAMPGGREWWRENGGAIKLTFDARPRSKSREALIKFQDRTKERRSMPAPDSSRRGIDCDNDPILDEVWDEIQENGLSGEAPSQEDWDRWDKEDQEAKDGKAREV